MNHDWMDRLVNAPPMLSLLLKVTVLLAIGWITHVALCRRNPRWRVLLWRGAATGVIALPLLAMGLPQIRLAIMPPPREEPLPPRPLTRVAVTYGGFAGTSLVESAMGSSTYSEPPKPPVGQRFWAWVGHWISEPPWQLAATAWGVTVLLLAAQAWRMHGRLRRVLRGSQAAPEPVCRLLARVAGELRCRRPVRLCYSRRVGTPLLAGVFRPVIVLPERMAGDECADDLPGILVHELAHLKSGDLLWSRVMQALTIGLWFHPLLWGIRASHASACEEVCDAAAAEYVGNTDAYSGTLARVALALIGQPAAVGGIPMARKAQIRARLETLRQKLGALPLRRGWVAAALVAGMAVTAVLGGLKISQAEPAEPQDVTALPRTTLSPDTPGARVLHFPANRSLGVLGVKDAGAPTDVAPSLGGDEAKDWEYFGEAMGDVTIPAGKWVRLGIHLPAALRDLSPLSSLGPNDLHTLSIRCDAVAGLRADERIMPHLRGLTGLKVLDLEYVNLTQRGVRSLAGLRSLTNLTIRTEAILKGASPSSRQLDDACLAQLAELKSLEILYLASHDITDAGLTHLAKLPALRELRLSTPTVRGPGLVSFVGHPALQSLNFFRQGFGDADLKYLSNLTSLKRLCLAGLPISDKGLVALSNLTALEELNLYNTQITGEGLVYLKPMRSLKRLDISKFGDNKTRVRDSGIAHLREIKSLEYLNALSNELTDRSLADLAGLTNLKCLYLPSVGSVGSKKEGYYCTDNGLKDLARLQLLEDLLVGSPAITDAGLAHLAELTRLKTLRINAKLVTNEGLPRLSNLKSLQTLQLDTPEVTLSGLNRLNALPNLTRLTAHSIRQDNLGLDISQLTKMEELTITLRATRKGQSMQFDQFRDEDLACLAKLTRLRSLQGIAGISDAGLKHLSGLTALTMLSAGGPNVTDNGLSYLAGMKDLYHLSINGDITDEGLRHLEGLKRLAYVNITSRSACSKAAMDRLRKALPNLQSLRVIP
jgi:beta-lactamase regulating signal transducer with metallopeptidase domain